MCNSWQCMFFYEIYIGQALKRQDSKEAISSRMYAFFSRWRYRWWNSGQPICPPVQINKMEEGDEDKDEATQEEWSAGLLLVWLMLVVFFLIGL